MMRESSEKREGGREGGRDRDRQVERESRKVALPESETECEWEESLCEWKGGEEMGRRWRIVCGCCVDTSVRPMSCKWLSESISRSPSASGRGSRI